MTVSYQYDVASSASGGFIRLLFRWRGSVWKVVYRDMLIFVVCYVLLTLLYQFVLTDSQQKLFERVVYFCSSFMDLIPLSFMLGFYVSFIATRWWSQYTAIPWPDKLMNVVAMYVPGLDEASRVVRRTLMRYLNLSLVLVLRSISMAVKRRFPTKEHLIEAGFMTKTELEMFQSVPSTEFNTFWIPCTWFINVLREARQECRITDSNGLKLIMEELNEFRSKCGLLWGYDWISIPLVYTQVVTMATYAFFVACMFGRQNVSNSDDPALKYHRYDYYIPIFSILQLMVYMGLLKVAEQLINPFGDDDEDFELNWIIDRHMKVSYLGVDTLNGTPPPLVKDTYYNELDVKIPYTEASRNYKKKTYRGSVAYMQVPMNQQGMVLPDVSEESDDDGETVSESMGPRRPSQYTLFQNKMESLTNLDNISLASSRNSVHKLPDINEIIAAKNSSGTLGCSSATPLIVDMPKAEDDEIILQEVVIDSGTPSKTTLARSESLQIPGGNAGVKEKKSSSLLSVLKDLSPKIAPKFPREKLKSMFRKKKMPSSSPFFKMKGVRFSKDTKEDVGDGDSETSSSTSSDYVISPRDVEITLSNPELTEREKEMGIHPYQRKAASPEELTKALVSLSLKQKGKRIDKQKGGSCDILESDIVEPVLPTVVRSCSLPSFQEETPLCELPTRMLRPQAKMLNEPLTKKERFKTPKKRKRKSPPPPPLMHSDEFELSPSDKDEVSDSCESLSSRRNTLPQITLTRYDKRIATPLDLAVPIGFGSSASSSRRSSDSTDTPAAPKRTHSLKSALKDSSCTSPSPDTIGGGKKQIRTSPLPTQSSKIHSTPPQIPPKHAPQSIPPRPTRTWSLTSKNAPTGRTSPTNIRSFDQPHAKSKTSTSLPTKGKTKSPPISPASTSSPSTPTVEVSPPFPQAVETPKPTIKISSPRQSVSSTDEKQDSKPTVLKSTKGRVGGRHSVSSIAGIQIVHGRSKDDNSHQPKCRTDPSSVPSTEKESKGDK